MLGSGWEFPQERGGAGGGENVRIIFLTFRYVLGVNICETHKRRKTIYTKKPVRSQHTRAKEYHLYFLHPFLLCVIQQFRKTSQVFSSRMTPHILTHESESWWDQTYHRPFSTSKICRNISEHLILHNRSLPQFFSGNSFVRPNVSAVLLVESKRLAFDALIFAQIHTINHTATAISFCNPTNDAEVMFWLKTSSIVVVFAHHFLTTTNETVVLLGVKKEINFHKFHLKIPLLDGAIAIAHWSRNITCFSWGGTCGTV